MGGSARPSKRTQCTQSSSNYSEKGSYERPRGFDNERDQRRNARQQQLAERQAALKRERQRQIRSQRLRLGSIIGGVILVIALVAVLLVATHQGPSPTSTGGLQPASGQVVDGMTCTSSEQLVFHIHSYLEIYVNGQPVTVPPGAGIVAPPGSGGYSPRLGWLKNVLVSVACP